MTTATTTPQLALTRIFDAPRALVYQAFTDPDHLAKWWGPIGNSLPRDAMDFDVRAAGVGCVKDPRPAVGAEAATVIARDLAAHLKRLDGPMRIHSERTARLLSAIRAVAAPDMHRLTANAVADRPAETSARAYSCLHARRYYATLRWAGVRECPL